MNRNSIGPSSTAWLLALGASSCTMGSGFFGGTSDLDTPDADGIVDNEEGGQTAPVVCDRGNAGLKLLPGFCASIVADDVGMARHMAVTPAGDLYVALTENTANPTGGLLALRDTDGDGRADVQRRIVDGAGSGVYWREGQLYVAQDDRVHRVGAPEAQLLDDR